jgi:hypothetical protein
MEEKPNKFEWTILIIFIISALGIIYYRINTPASEVNQLTTVLLSTFEVLLSLYIGYFLQRLDSIKRSRESLKKYGFLAYRRIMDIRKSISRLFDEIARMNKYLPEDKTNEVRILHSILEGTFDTVESSVLDWVDIIGEDLSKKEKVDRLQESLAVSELQLKSSEVDTKRIEDIKKELEQLKSEIPSALQVSNYGDDIEKQKFIFYTNYLTNFIGRDGFVRLVVKIIWGVPLSQDEEQEISTGYPYLLRISRRFGNPVIDVYTKDKRKIGHLISPINEHENKPFLFALENTFALDFLEDNNPEGYIIPARCEFGGFVRPDEFELMFSSDVFPGG